MQRVFSVAGAAVLAGAIGVWMHADDGQQTGTMTFFITSAGPGDGANLGGLDGADKHCQALAQQAGAGARTWRAYLSTQAEGNKPAINARDRIGKGPWHNAAGLQIAASVDDLHSANNKIDTEGGVLGKRQTMRVGLTVMTARESARCLDFLHARVVDRRIAEQMLAHAQKLRDAVRSQGTADAERKRWAPIVKASGAKVD